MKCENPKCGAVCPNDVYCISCGTMRPPPLGVDDPVLVDYYGIERSGRILKMRRKTADIIILMDVMAGKMKRITVPINMLRRRFVD